MDPRPPADPDPDPRPPAGDSAGGSAADPATNPAAEPAGNAEVERRPGADPAPSGRASGLWRELAVYTLLRLALVAVLTALLSLSCR